MSGTLSALRLIELTAVRLCHALDSSVARLNQVVSARAKDDVTIADATRALTKQLDLLQLAWGPAERPVPLSQIVILARGLPDHIAVDLSALPPATVFPPSLGRVMLNILLLAADSLPEGGRVILAGSLEDLFVRITGPAAAWPIGMTLCLANEAEARSALIDGRNVQMALTILLANAADIRLSALLAPNTQAEPAILRLGR